MQQIRSVQRDRLYAGAVAAALLVVAGPAGAESVELDARSVYEEHCASCHGVRRYGGYAPPLIPSTLDRKDDDTLAAAIVSGLPSTQMPAFGHVIDAELAAALVALMREPAGEIRWSTQDIAASRVELPIERSAIPPAVRRKNLTLVVERGTGSVVVLDGDRMTELDRFEVGRIHGGLKFDAGLRKALASTRDGTLVDYDLVRGGLRTRVKVGVNTRNIAVSPDGAFVAAANQLPAGLVVLDGGLRPLALFALPGQPSAVYPVPGGGRFLVALRDVPELYSVGLPDLTLREVELPEPFEDFTFVPGSTRLVASSRGGRRLVLYDYEREQVLATLATQGLPHLFSASFFTRDGVLHAAFNHMGVPRLSVVEMKSFTIVREIALRGPGYFARTHPGTPYIWVDTNTDGIQLVAKQTLALEERVLVPEAGKKAMHVEFTENGGRALVSVWHDEGAVVVYDSETLEELRRLAFAMPVGKYNAANKTRLLR
jgi:mono/diheme cytochrome c family protein